MSTQDRVAELLTIIRNALMIKKEFVIVEHSNLKLNIISKLCDTNFIKNFTVINDANSKFKKIKVIFKYIDGKSVISGLKRVSKPSVRVYTKAHDIRFFRNNYGIALISTSAGILSEREAVQRNLGGEVIAKIW